VTKKNSCAVAIFVTMISFMDSVTIVIHQLWYKYHSAIKHPQKSLGKAWIHLQSLELEIVAFCIQSLKR
jgi:hypothetical protein